MPESPIRQSGIAGADPAAGGQGGDGGGVDRGVGVGSRSRPAAWRGGTRPRWTRRARRRASRSSHSASSSSATGTRVGAAGHVRPRRSAISAEPVADGRQPQHPAGRVDRGVGGLLGEPGPPLRGRHDSTCRRGRASGRAASLVAATCAATARRDRREVRWTARRVSVGCRPAAGVSGRLSTVRSGRWCPAVRGWVAALAGLDGDHVRGWSTDGQRGADPGDDVGSGQVAVQQQHLDQGAGAAAVAVARRGPRPRTPRGRR